MLLIEKLKDQSLTEQEKRRTREAYCLVYDQTRRKDKRHECARYRP